MSGARPYPRTKHLSGPLARALALAVTVAAALALTSCGASTLKKPGDAGNAQPGSGPGGSEPGVTLPDGGGADSAAGPRAPGAGEQCVEEAITGELIPLDLMLVLDGSGSMNVMVGGKTRWQQVSEALGSFVRDPRSAGLGVGIQVFPFTIVQKPCTTEEDCGDSGPVGGADATCARPFLCAGPGVNLETTRGCDPNDAYCPEMGTSCTASGRCSQSGARCLNLGQACPGGMAGDLCSQAATVCKLPIDSCLEADYAQPRVAIGSLPAAVGTVMQGLAAVRPGGNTPINPAVAAAAKNLRAHLMANPGHRGALVLASDVSPSGCADSTVNTVAATLQAARMATPAITTYVIGAVSAGDMIRGADAVRLAQAGGTTMPLIINDGSGDLGSKFLEALSAIRGNALSCEFRIPKPASGTIDHNKVNVRFVGATGPDDLVYVTNAGACHPSKGGWYYDVDPATGTPSTVQVCPATCARFKADAGGAVELRFGCRTRID